MATITITSTTIEHMLICWRHEEPVYETTEQKSLHCPDCGDKMENAGWFESRKAGIDCE